MVTYRYAKKQVLCVRSRLVPRKGASCKKNFLHSGDFNTVGMISAVSHMFAGLWNLSLPNPRHFRRLAPDDPGIHLLIRLLHRRS